jgi:hypothetical protein
MLGAVMCVLIRVKQPLDVAAGCGSTSLRQCAQSIDLSQKRRDLVPTRER